MHSRDHSVELMQANTDVAQAVFDEADGLLEVPWAQMIGPAEVDAPSPSHSNAISPESIIAELQDAALKQHGKSLSPYALGRVKPLVSHMSQSAAIDVYPRDSLAILVNNRLLDAEMPHPKDVLSSDNIRDLDQRLNEGLFTIHTAAHMATVGVADQVSLRAARTDMMVDGCVVAQGYRINEEHSGVSRTTEIAKVLGAPYAMGLRVTAAHVQKYPNRVGEITGFTVATTDNIQRAIYDCTVYGERYVARKLSPDAFAFVSKQAKLVVQSVLPYNPERHVPGRAELTSTLGHLAAASKRIIQS